MNGPKVQHTAARSAIPRGRSARRQSRKIMFLLIRFRPLSHLVTWSLRTNAFVDRRSRLRSLRNMRTTRDTRWARFGKTGWSRRIQVSSLGLLSALVAISLATPSDAAKVKGLVVGFKLLRNPVWVEAQDASRHAFSFREAVPTVPAETRQLYPFIPKELCVAALASEKQAPPPPVLIRIGGGRTAPVTIVVPPLTKLSFQNTDPFPHRLYGFNLPSFGPSDTGRGANRDWTVPAAGVFELRDEAAPSLRMWVIGDDNVAAIAYPSLKGEFQLSIGQPGEYQVQGFFSGKKVGAPITIKVTAADIDLAKTPIVVAKKDSSGAKDKDKDKDNNDESDKSNPEVEGSRADAGVKQ